MTSLQQIVPSASASNTTLVVGVAMTASNGRLPTHAPAFVSRADLFFWEKDWQDGERESAKERHEGGVVTFDTATDLMKWLLSDD